MEYLSKDPRISGGETGSGISLISFFTGGMSMPMMTLAGGKQVECYENRACMVCGKELHGEVACRKYRANICQEHCQRCRWYIPYTQNCQYKRRKP